VHKGDIVGITEGEYKNRTGILLQGTNLHGFYWVEIEGLGNQLIREEHLEKLNPSQMSLPLYIVEEKVK